jgi:hypothetical protein
LSHFSDDLGDFYIQRIYSSQEDGWLLEDFKKRVFGQGASLIVIESTKDQIFGGYTSIGWQGTESYKKDKKAFVFNLEDKFPPDDIYQAIYQRADGFEFGNSALGICAEQDLLCFPNSGYCLVGSETTFYNLLSNKDGDSPLTNECETFSCKNLEVFKILPRSSSIYRDEKSSMSQEEEEDKNDLEIVRGEDNIEISNRPQKKTRDWVPSENEKDPWDSAAKNINLISKAQKIDEDEGFKQFGKQRNKKRK